MSKTPTLYCDDGSELELPYRWEICGHCRGEGKSSAYLGAFTAYDRREVDDEWWDDYMAGAFDRTCDDCGGAGKVKVVDWKKLTPDQKRQWNKQVRDAREIDAIARMERAMGA